LPGGRPRKKGTHPSFWPSGKIKKKGERIEEGKFLKIKEKLAQASNIADRASRQAERLKSLFAQNTPLHQTAPIIEEIKAEVAMVLELLRQIDVAIL
jgi:hypothetical protein